MALVDKNNWVIKSLWIGPRLSIIEQLALNSFLKNGHRVELFAYDPVEGIPEGIHVRDGRDILAENLIFKYKEYNSFSAFSNWFRYEMFFKEGGVWVDVDEICLKPFDFDDDLFFGLEQPGRAGSSVIGSKPGNSLFQHLSSLCESPNKLLPYDSFKQKKKKLVRRFFRGNQRGDIKWGERGPEGLTRALHHYNLFDLAKNIDIFYPLRCSDWESAFDDTYKDIENIFPESYAVHLWNEMLRRSNFDKESRFPKGSLIDQLISKYM